ncbi:MAG: hypothetical protein KDD11_01625 [Acidobacteria bacterium]|nr:hypothetical protein [Acidobacteriota bacterium]
MSRDQLTESRRRLEEDLAALQRGIEGTVGWAPRGKAPVLLLLGVAAGFAVARMLKKR